MKKLAILVLVLALMFSFCACGKTGAVKDLEARIDSLANVTLADQATVSGIRYDYMMLSAEEQEDVENLAVLEAAEAIIQEELQKQREQIDVIVAEYDPQAAFALLREMGDVSYARYSIRSLAEQMIKEYVLNEGFASDYSGDPEEDGDFMTVSVSYGGQTLRFMLEMENGNLTFETQDDDPVNRMVDSDYTLYRRSRTQYITGSRLYYESEHFKTGSDYFFVSWTTSVPSGCTEAQLSKLPVEVKSSLPVFWPYYESEYYIEENMYANVDRLMDDMDDCLRALDMPFTACELMGIFE